MTWAMADGIFVSTTLCKFSVTESVSGCAVMPSTPFSRAERFLSPAILVLYDSFFRDPEDVGLCLAAVDEVDGD